MAPLQPLYENYPTNQLGKFMQVGDKVSPAPVQVTGISGTGPSGSVTIQFASGASVTVLGSDIASGAQTL